MIIATYLGMLKVSHLKIILFSLLLATQMAVAASESAFIRLHSEALSSLKARIESIRNARKEILIEAFYLEDDEVGNELMQEISIQKKRYPNLNVQIIIDAWGSASFPKANICELKNLGFQIRQYNPVGFFQLSFKTVRTHRKIWIADGQSFIGGRNLADEHFFATEPYSSAKDDWDVEIKYGSITEKIKSSFLEMWGQSKEVRCQSADVVKKVPHHNIDKQLKEVVLPDFKIAKINWYTETLNKENIVYKKVIQLIGQAQQSLFAENAFFIPPENLTRTLISLAEKNIEIDLLLNGPQLELPIMGFYTSCLSYFEQSKLFKENIKIYNTQSDVFTHAKAFLVDNKVLGIGSFNWDYRSAEWNSETLLTIEDSEVIDDFKQQFFKRQQKARLVKTEQDFWPQSQKADMEKLNCESKKSMLYRLKKYF